MAPYVGGKYNTIPSKYYYSTGVYVCPSPRDASDTGAMTSYCYATVNGWANRDKGVNLTQISKNKFKLASVGLLADSAFQDYNDPASGFVIGIPNVSSWSSSLRNRHSKGLNILYLDGHAQYQKAGLGESLKVIFTAY